MKVLNSEGGASHTLRYSDDFVVGFEQERDAHAFLAELRERFAQFGLELHSNKTRIVEFGRYATDDRARRGEGKPETFDFLGFMHICAKTRKGRFRVQRKTMKKRLRAKLSEVKTELRRRITQSIPEQGAYLRAVLLGHARYYGVPGNGAALQVFRYQLRLALGAHTASPRQPPRPNVAASPKSHRPLAPDSAYLSFLAFAAPRRQDPRQEPDAVMPHVRICGGGDQR